MSIAVWDRLRMITESMCLDDVVLIEAYFTELSRKVKLPAEQKEKMLRDFVDGIHTLFLLGIEPKEILRRFSIDNLSELYQKELEEWYPLDDGAKQYPITMPRGTMPMFRIAAELHDEVIPELLQLALVFLLRRFPHFATQMKKGFFWYYLKSTSRYYEIIKDRGEICQPIDLTGEDHQLFRVLYREKYIIVEIFHILTDGGGGLIFLESLLAEYYRLLGGEIAEDGQIRVSSVLPKAEETENCFTRFGRKWGIGKVAGSLAIQLPGIRSKAEKHRVERYCFPADVCKDAAKKAGTTMTTLLSAAILSACEKTAKAESGVYKLQIPVNLRDRFGFKTLRNCSWFTFLEWPAEKKMEIGEAIETLTGQLEAGTSNRNLREEISAGRKMIGLTKYIPLTWKEMVMRPVYSITGDFFCTATLSNLGKVQMPESLSRKIACLEFTLGPSASNNRNLGIVTFENQCTITVTRQTEDDTFEKHFITSLQDMGIEGIEEKNDQTILETDQDGYRKHTA